MPLSKDPDLRARQLANLSPNAAMRHGAHAERDIAPVRTEHLARLRLSFPSADDAVLTTQADRAAQIDLINAYLARRLGVGAVLRNRRTATVWPALEYAAKLASAYERQHERLEAQQRDSRDNPGETLRSIEQEYLDADGDDDGAA